MGIITGHKQQHVSVTRCELRRLIGSGKWAAFVENFKAMRDLEGVAVIIRRV